MNKPKRKVDREALDAEKAKPCAACGCGPSDRVLASGVIIPTDEYAAKCASIVSLEKRLEIAREALERCYCEPIRNEPCGNCKALEEMDK